MPSVPFPAHAASCCVCQPVPRQALSSSTYFNFSATRRVFVKTDAILGSQWPQLCLAWTQAATGLCPLLTGPLDSGLLSALTSERTLLTSFSQGSSLNVAECDAVYPRPGGLKDTGNNPRSVAEAQGRSCGLNVALRHRLRGWPGRKEHA